MKKYLVDTHILIWHSQNQELLSPLTLSRLKSPASKLFVSQASYWEMTIKRTLGKLHLSVPISEFCAEATANSFQVLPILTEHFSYLETLPTFHNDPFDRMIIAQAMSEDMVIVTQDRKFSLYENIVKLFWN